MAMKDKVEREIKRFTYNGKKLGELTPVTDIKDYDQQLEEIVSRLKAIDDYCWENGLILTPTHMQNVLGVSSSTFSNMKTGKTCSLKKSGCLSVEEVNARCSEERERFLLARRDILNKWTDIGKQMCLDRCSTDQYPTGSIYLSKAVYHNWDTPQQEAEGKVSIEILLGKALKAKKREKKADD